MAVTAGSYTIGPTTGDYPSLNTAIANIGTPLTGDLTFTVIEGHNVLTAASWGGDLAGFTLKITSDNPPTTDMDSGHIILVTGLVNPIRFYSHRNLGVPQAQIIIENLNLRCGSVNFNKELVYLYSPRSVTGGHIKHTVRNCILDRTRSTTSAINTAACYVDGDGYTYRRRDYDVYNVIIWERASSNASPGSFYLDNSDSVCKIENCVVIRGAGSSFPGFDFENEPIECRNCVVTDPNLNNGFFRTAGATGYNNISEGTSAQDGNWPIGSGNLTGVTPASIFESLSPTGGQDFLFPKGAAAHGGAVKNIPTNTTGFNGITRPHVFGAVGKYSIGAKEYPSVPAITQQPTTQRIDENTQATFQITATDATGYQWQKKGFEETSLFYDIIGANSPTYVTPQLGAVDHQTQYRCIVTNAAGEVISTEVYLLINGFPDPGAPSAGSPDPPTVTVVSFENLTVILEISDQIDADVWYAQATDSAGNIVDSVQITTAGQIELTFPRYSDVYSVVVQAGATNSPPVWSLPGFSVSYTVGAEPVIPTPRTPIEPDVDEEPLYSDLDPDLRTDWQGNVLVVTDVEALQAQLENSFGIEPGEVIMEPYLGSDLTKVVGRNVSVAASDFIRMVVSKTLEDQDRLIVDRAQVEARPDDNEYRIFLEFRDRPTQLKGTLERFVGGENKL